jgi:hypothetical protein
LGLKRRLVTLWAWLMLLPTRGFFPHISHIFDIFRALLISYLPIISFFDESAKVSNSGETRNPENTTERNKPSFYGIIIFYPKKIRTDFYR